MASIALRLLLVLATHERYRFIRMLALLIATLGLTVLSFAAPRPVGYGSLPPLRFTSNGTFQIAIFEDLHFGESMCGFHCC